MRATAGRVMMWIRSSMEIHEQNHTEGDLWRANQDLEQFTCAASHDLQVPLRGIKIHRELVARRYQDRPDAQGADFLQYLPDGASRMEELMGGLRTYTRLIQVDNPVDPVDAGAALDAALDNRSGAIEESRGQVTRGPMPSLPVHSTQLQQLFQDPIGNAIRYRRADAVAVVHIGDGRKGDL